VSFVDWGVDEVMVRLRQKDALVNFEEVFEIQEMLFSAHFFLRLLYYLCIAH
jgi:hypothetical protein